MTLVVILKVTVASGREHEFEELTAERAALHRKSPGFDRMYLLKGDRPNEIRLVSWWRDLANPESWVRKEMYALSEHPKHAGLVVGPMPHETLEVARAF